MEWFRIDNCESNVDHVSETGSDSESGEEICGSHDPQRQDGRGANGGELQGGCGRSEAAVEVSPQ